MVMMTTTTITTILTDMKRKDLFLLLLCALCACSSSSDDRSKDMTMPEISDNGIIPTPENCQAFGLGDTIHFHYIFTDDRELGSYNIEIHNNFDHHTHSTSAVECVMEPSKQPVQPWVYNKDHNIPQGQRFHEALFDIVIPKDVDPGDYHFMIRLTDQAGWQQLKSVSIKLVDF